MAWLCTSMVARLQALRGMPSWLWPVPCTVQLMQHEAHNRSWSHSGAEQKRHASSSAQTHDDPVVQVVLLKVGQAGAAGCQIYTGSNMGASLQSVQCACPCRMCHALGRRVRSRPPALGGCATSCFPRAGLCTQPLRM